MDLIGGLGEIAARYDVVLSDVWGVVHNGLRAHAEAGEALATFRRQGGCVVMISNAPRPAASVVAQMRQIGVRDDAYDAVATSGDVTRMLALAQPDRRCHHIGPERDEPLFDNLDVRRTTLDEAAFVVCSGLVDDETETAEDYAPQLEAMRARGLSMICANPDLVVERGDRLIPCAGAVAALYEAMGGEVIQAGKPFRPIYDLAISLAERAAGRQLDRRRTLAVGDAIRTDVAGAAAIGVDSLFITSGIHAGEIHRADGAIDRERLAAFLSRQPQRPSAAMRHLAW